MLKIHFSQDRIRDDWFDTYGWSVINYPEGLSPTDYINFAHDDLEEGVSQRNLINSISNAKRALHLEIETLCAAFGKDNAKKKAKTFPQRLEFLNSCGIVKPRLLTKFNEIRNLVEHEYYVPTKDEVEDFIGVTELFIEAMRLPRSRYPSEVDLCGVTDDSGQFQATMAHTNFSQGLISLKLIPIENGRGKEFYKEISVNDPDYCAWVSFVLKNNY